MIDVFIAGGGLAGLCLARQLTLETPHLRVVVAEKRRHPVREAAFKVGESSVEIGAHYFHERLGLAPHLREGHLEKLGLRYFFPQGANRELHRRVELGPPVFPPVPSFQIDRGRLENFLLRSVRESGVEVIDACSVRRLGLGDPYHTIDLESAAGVRVVRARWIADASGRAGLLRRQLGLTRAVAHEANACWFRIRRRLRVDDWSDDIEWRARVPSGSRWQSTVHLMGRGYWVWLIPLGSGSTSFGIVADDAIHPFARINRLERALDWLREHEPQCASVVEAHLDDVEDFLALRHFAYGCQRVFSSDRWVLTGEAGLFTDPFYSPGSDFIAMGNDYATDLITRERLGEEVASRIEAFNATYLRLFEGFLRLYTGQYAVMGSAQVMTAKVAWDNASYWAIPALLFFQRRLRNPEFIASIDGLMRRFFLLHGRMQHLFGEWHLLDRQAYADQASNIMLVDELRALQSALGGPHLGDDELRARLERNYTVLERLARAVQATAAEMDSGLARSAPPGVSPIEPLDITPLHLSPLAAAAPSL